MSRARAPAIVVMLILALLATPAAGAPAGATDGPDASPPAAPASGLRLDLKFPIVTNFLDSSGGTTTSFAPGGGVPQLLVGYQLGRFGLLLGAGVASVTSSVLLAGRSSSATTTVITLAPTFTADLVRSEQARAALFALAALPIGASIGSSSGAAASVDASFFVQAALGARVALHPHFHLGVEVGPLVFPLDQWMVAMYGALFVSYVH